ncbi:MAG: tellurium resistance protein TerC [Hirschia sp.]|nr:tellurium resistance protein TerC [Hirschia sp.]MBF17009.1 tellurium resistance protein TerC [Hirschia sp.]
MAELFTVSGFFTLLMLLALQAVLGFDNLLYISIESKRVGEAKAPMVRRWGIGLAMVFRIVLLIIIVNLFGALSEPMFDIPFKGFIEGHFTLQSLVTLAGGAFIIYTAIKEISHLMVVDHIEDTEGNEKKSVAQAIAMIVAMNLVFSFDSILSAMAIANTKTPDGETQYQVWIMAVAILSSGILMMLMADYVADFLKKNRMYEVLGLFILFLVGVLLVSEGGHLAHLTLFGYEIEALSKSTFYLVIGVLVITDIIQTNYQKRLWSMRERELLGKHSSTATDEPHG